MSYSFTVPAGDRETLSDRIRTAYAEYAGRSNWGDAQSAVDDHIEAAIRAADVLVAVVGATSDEVDRDEVVVSIAGHANVGHRQQAGYANETISVSVNVAPAAIPDRPQPEPPQQPPAEPSAGAPDAADAASSPEPRGANERSQLAEAAEAQRPDRGGGRG